MSVKDRLEEWWIASEFTLTKNQLIAVAVLGSVILGGWLFYYFSQSTGTEIKVEKKSEVKEAKVATKVFIHVAGAVVKSGVYEMDDGSRVIDAIKAAGGFTKDADPDSLNLAATVMDSQKVYVKQKGNEQALGQNAAVDEQESDVINLNMATAKQLEELSGIGETIAERIVEFREEKGSFSSIDQLKDVEGIGEKKFEKIKEEVSL